MSLGDVLRHAREAQGLSVRALAARVGLSPATLREAERGGDSRLSTLERLGPALGLPAERLLARHPERATRGEIALRFARGFGWRARRLVATIDATRDDVAPFTAEARVEGARALDEAGAETTRVLQQLVRGTPSAPRRVADALARGEPRGEAHGELQDEPHGELQDEPRGELHDEPRGELHDEPRGELHDDPFVHRWTGVPALRSGLDYRRETLAPPSPGAPWSGQLPASAPFDAGASIVVDIPVEELVLVVRFARGDALPLGEDFQVWADGLALPPESANLAGALFSRRDAAVRRSPRDATIRLVVQRPVFGFHHGLSWCRDGVPDGDDAQRSARSTWIGPSRSAASRGPAIAAARRAAGLSTRALARRLDVSPATIGGAERGQDARRSLAVAALESLPTLSPSQLLPRSGACPASHEETWAFQRDALGVEAEAERKTLLITADGDAHAVCETVRLRRVSPASTDLRVRYGSAPARGRLPTELRAIEEELAREMEDAFASEAESAGEADEGDEDGEGGWGLRARVVARHGGRLIHEITVPREQAVEGVSFARRLHTPRFFDPGDDEPAFDGAALVPFHPTRRLRLEVRFPVGHFPENVWFGVHPRLMVDAPLPSADLAARLHPDGWSTRRDPERRALVLEASMPLVGLLYDIFWERVTQGS